MARDNLSFFLGNLGDDVARPDVETEALLGTSQRGVSTEHEAPAPLRAEGEEPDKAMSGSTQATAELGRTNVLIVEDDAEIREMVRLTLELEGYVVAEASNGKEGLEAIAKMKAFPCLILLDLMMPVMNGWDFVESLEKDADWARIPVVVVTAFANKVKDIKAREVLKKPIPLEELLDVARRYCGSR